MLNHLPTAASYNMMKQKLTTQLPDYLRKELLKKSSRSFYLTLSLVPVAIRDTLALSYLIARITDTIVDKINIEKPLKISLLALILTTITEEKNEQALIQLKQQLSTLDATGIDNELILALPCCINYFHQLPPADKALAKQVLTTLFSAFQQDLINFADSNQLQFLLTINDLQNYLYQIAGCVGEFWADVSYIHWPHYSTLPLAAAKSLAIEYGKALQLVNILRDLPEDLKNNRCYLPVEQIRSFNISANAIINSPEQLFPLALFWTKQTRQYLQSAKQYVSSVTFFIQRYALCLPLLIAEKTLDKLQDDNYLKYRSMIKATRFEMKIIMLKAVFYAALPMLLISKDKKSN